MTWDHIGGGCRLGCNAGYPCDDDYENTDTGERMRFYSTKEAHFAMPRTVERLVELRDREGVEDRVRIMDRIVDKAAASRPGRNHALPMKVTDADH